VDVYAPKVLQHAEGRRQDEGPDPRRLEAPARARSPSLRAMRSRRSSRPGRGQGKPLERCVRDWGAFRAMLADAVDRGHLAAIPMARRPEPIRKLQGNKRVRYLGQRDTDEERAAGKGEEVRFGKALAAFASHQALEAETSYDSLPGWRLQPGCAAARSSASPRR